MSQYGEKAKALFLEGYNCAQAVFLAFAEELGMDSQTATMLSSSFGGGMGRLREVCGAVSGMFMVAGLKYGYTSPIDQNAKAEHYKRIQQLAEYFKQNNGSIICRELLGLKSGPDHHVPEIRSEQYYKARPCDELVKDAADIIAAYIAQADSEN